MAGQEAGGVDDAHGGSFAELELPPPPSAPLPPPPPPPPPGAGAPGTVYVPGAPPTAPPTGLATLSTVAQVLVGVVGVLSLASLVLNLRYASEVDEFAVGSTSLDTVESLENQIGALAALYLLGILVSAIVFLVWQARLRQTAEALGANGFRHSRGMAIGGWFIPFANLVIPKKAVDDLWRGTEPSHALGFHIGGRPVAGIVSAWWALWLIGNVFGAGFGSDDTLGAIASSARRAAVGSALTVGAAILAVLVIRRLTARAEARAANLGVRLT